MSDHTAYTWRSATSADAPAIAALHADSWRRHYRGAYSDAYLDGDVAADRLAVWSARLAAADPRRVTVIVESDQGLAGFAHVVLENDPRWGALVDNLHVAAALHRRGLGARLITEVARSVGSGPMYLWVLEQNSAAQGFYRAQGGEVVERAEVPPPGGVPGRLNGTPMCLRIAWPDASALVDSRRPGPLG